MTFVEKCEMVTIFSLILIFLIEFIFISKEHLMPKNVGQAAWQIIAKRTGITRGKFRILLPSQNREGPDISLIQGLYYLGNRRRQNDIYVDVTGEPIRVHLNIQNERAYFTVVSGCVSYHGKRYEEDTAAMIEIFDHHTITLGDMDLQFVKVGGV